MVKDREGFEVPQVDSHKCVLCGACDNVCPAMHNATCVPPLACYAAKSLSTEILESSASGGAAQEICRITINSGGVVFGCAFDERLVARHIMVDNLRDLHKLQGSKYVQSSLGGIYNRVKAEAKMGRRVVFIGVPCQVHGLSLFLGKDYTNVVKVEILCHGGTSPRLFEAAKEKWSKKVGQKIIGVNFKGKRIAWDKPELVLDYANGSSVSKPLYSDNYVMSFEHRLANRRSCMRCVHRCGKSGADLTIGDFWGIDVNYPNLYSRMGVSLVVVRSKKGESLLRAARLDCHEVDYAKAYAYNPALEYDNSASIARRNIFFRLVRVLPIGLSDLFSRFDIVLKSNVRIFLRRGKKFLKGLI